MIRVFSLFVAYITFFEKLLSSPLFLERSDLISVIGRLFTLRCIFILKGSQNALIGKITGKYRMACTPPRGLKSTIRGVRVMGSWRGTPHDVTRGITFFIPYLVITGPDWSGPTLESWKSTDCWLVPHSSITHLFSFTSCLKELKKCCPTFSRGATLIKSVCSLCRAISECCDVYPL